MLPSALLFPLFVSQVIHVDASATGANDGSSWADAFTDLQLALAVDAPGDQIWVAAGTYKPSSTGDRDASFVLEVDRKLYGGFAGTESTLDQRARLFHSTILSGDLLGDDGPGFANRTDNSRHVVHGPGQVIVLDGFTITGGNADDYGGGLLLPFGYSRIENCTFRANRAVGEGGAVATANADESVFIRCDFIGNHSRGKGGAVSIDGFKFPPRFENCRFLGNSAAREGGGIRGTGGVDLVGCEFSGNSAHRGGAMSIHRPRLQNCTLSSNSAPGGSGGGIVSDLGPMILRSSILWGNVDSSGNGEAAQVQVYGTFPIVQHCCIEGWTGTIDDGPGNLFGDPRFVDADGADGVLGTPDDDLRLAPGSPCVDTGAEAPGGPVLPATDLDGNPRFINSLACDGDGVLDHVLDIGAHERRAFDGSTSFCAQPPTSLGVPAEISAPCVVGVAGGEVLFRVGPVQSSTGFLWFGSQTASVSFGIDTSCVGGEMHRLPHLTRIGNMLALDLDLAHPSAAALVAGSTWHFQALFRDAGALRLSDATTITFRD